MIGRTLFDVTMKLRRFGLVMALAPFGTICHGQSASPSASPPSPHAEEAGRAESAMQIGDATARLLELQRSSKGQPRPIRGDEASLSYQRYLNSFNNPIPSYLGSTVGKTAASGASQ